MDSLFRVNPFRKPRPILTLRLDVAFLVLTIPALLLLFSLFSLSSHIHKLSRAVPPVTVTGLSVDAPASHPPPPPPLHPQDDPVRRRLLSDLPKCAADGRALSFLMVFQGHSGSTALMTSLRQHSQTYIDGFEPVDHGIYAEKGENASASALSYTKHFFVNATAHKLTSGFKIRPTHLLRRPLSFSSIVRHFNTRIIWSYRSNILKQAIGDYRIHYYNDRASYEGLKASSDYKSRAASIEISDMRALFRLMVQRVRADRSLSMALHAISPDACLLPVSYESYLRNPALTLERVQRFLGLDAAEVHPPERAKANQDSLCDLVSNWQDLCRAFFPCVEWRWMMDDYENGCSCSNLAASSFNASRAYCNLNSRAT